MQKMIISLCLTYLLLSNMLLHPADTATEYILYILGVGFIVELVSVLQEPTINHSTFSRSFKEWKFCQYELCRLQGMDWFRCPTCSISQHSCHVDGNMKLYRYQSSGRSGL